MNVNKKFLIVAITAAFTMIMIFSVLFYVPGFTQKKGQINDKKAEKPKDSVFTGKLPKTDTSLVVDNHKVLIKTSTQKKKGTFLVLQGWNLPVEDWCSKTELCSKATTNGYCVVLPDMGKSIYQQKDYLETRVEWRSFPTRQWLSDTLIPMLQKKYGLLLKNENNYIVGLSTGARGVALVLLDFPDLFKGAAALSGDYNQLKLPADNLMAGYYGSFTQFRDRWTNTDNPIMRIKEYHTPIYLGHGKLDKVVPPEQTVMFYDSLVKNHPKLKVKLNMPDNNKHDYVYWGSEVDNIFKFFGILK